MLTSNECEAIAREHGSPFYLFDRDEFVGSFQRLAHAFRARWERVLLAYSYKTNYLPYACRLVRDMGGYAEVVSRLEYELALRVGHDPRTIVFNGPAKGRDDVELALGGGALVNADSVRDLEHAAAFAARHPGAPVRIGLRINMNLADDAGVSHVQDGLSVGRFGLALDALPQLAPALARGGLRVVALHGHTSSSSRSAWIFERIAETLCRVAAELFPDTVEDVDVGGGFFGAMPPGFAPPGAPSVDDYAAAIVGALERSAWARARSPRLVLEPGVALAASALRFVTRVLEVKELRGERLAVVDGSVFNVKPTMHHRNQPYAVIRAPGRPPADGRRVTVVGSTCMEKDRLLEDVSCDLEAGDHLRIDNVGAYTIVMTPPFIRPAPAIVMRGDGGRLVALRRRQTFDDIFGPYAF